MALVTLKNEREQIERALQHTPRVTGVDARVQELACKVQEVAQDIVAICKAVNAIKLE